MENSELEQIKKQAVSEHMSRLGSISGAKRAHNKAYYSEIGTKGALKRWGNKNKEKQND